MDYKEYRDGRLARDAELAKLYAMCNRRLRIRRWFYRLLQRFWF